MQAVWLYCLESYSFELWIILAKITGSHAINFKVFSHFCEFTVILFFNAYFCLFENMQSLIQTTSTIASSLIYTREKPLFLTKGVYGKWRVQTLLFKPNHFKWNIHILRICFFGFGFVLFFTAPLLQDNVQHLLPFTVSSFLISSWFPRSFRLESKIILVLGKPVLS